MTDFLTGLLNRFQSNDTPTIQPRLPSLFEPEQPLGEAPLFQPVERQPTQEEAFLESGHENPAPSPETRQEKASFTQKAASAPATERPKSNQTQATRDQLPAKPGRDRQAMATTPTTVVDQARPKTSHFQPSRSINRQPPARIPPDEPNRLPVESDQPPTEVTSKLAPRTSATNAQPHTDSSRAPQAPAGEQRRPARRSRFKQNTDGGSHKPTHQRTTANYKPEDHAVARTPAAQLVEITDATTHPPHTTTAARAKNPDQVNAFNTTPRYHEEENSSQHDASKEPSGIMTAATPPVIDRPYPAPIPEPEPVINVTIGRIEVRARITPPKTPAKRKSAPKPVMGLNDYLRQRGSQNR